MNISRQRRCAWLGLMSLLEQHDGMRFPGLFSQACKSTDAKYVKEILCDHLGIVNSRFDKPVFRDRKDLWFNISHCRLGVAAVISDVPVGVDVERRFAWNEKLARRIAHPAELEAMLRLDAEKERQALLNLIWSRKESFLKCRGTGFSEDPRSFNVLETGIFRELQDERMTMCVCMDSYSQ